MCIRDSHNPVGAQGFSGLPDLVFVPSMKGIVFCNDSYCSHKFRLLWCKSLMIFHYNHIWAVRKGRKKPLFDKKCKKKEKYSLFPIFTPFIIELYATK